MIIKRLSVLVLLLLLTLNNFLNPTYSQETKKNKGLPKQVTLQQAIQEVLEKNKGIQVKVSSFERNNQKVLVYNLVEFSGQVSSTDIFRVFLQFSDKIQDRSFNSVELHYKGDKRFLLDGVYYQKIGKEYSYQNPVYTVRTFPQNVFNVDDSKAFPTWTGGMIGVTNKQMEDFGEFNRRWYLNSWIEEQNNIQNKNRQESSDPSHDF